MRELDLPRLFDSSCALSANRAARTLAPAWPSKICRPAAITRGARPATAAASAAAGGAGAVALRVDEAAARALARPLRLRLVALLRLPRPDPVTRIGLGSLCLLFR